MYKQSNLCKLLTTSEDIVTEAEKRKLTLYVGADPSASSLHVGNLIPLFVLLHFYIRGHSAIPLVGGATGVVGDPSGRKTERTALIADERESNVQKIHGQMQRFLENGWKYAQTKGYTEKGDVTPANNADWWKDMGMLYFLGTYGRHIRVAQMLARDSVKSRLDSEAGIGFNEFTYQVLQAYDFWHMYKTMDCSVQIGGNDQWGNITAGIDLISRLREHSGRKDDAYGLTVPLLTTPSGEKFGKSAGNAVFIDRALTKPYDLYQYFIRAPDAVVESYLRMFTLIPLSEISRIMEEHTKSPELRVAQRALANDVTDIIHGLGAGKRAALISKIVFPSPGEPAPQATSDEIITAFGEEGLLKTYPRDKILGQAWRSVLALVTGKSKSECGRTIKAGGVYCGLQRKTVVDGPVTEADIADDKLLLIRVGKTNYYTIHLA